MIGQRPREARLHSEDRASQAVPFPAHACGEKIAVREPDMISGRLSAFGFFGGIMPENDANRRHFDETASS